MYSKSHWLLGLTCLLLTLSAFAQVKTGGGGSTPSSSRPSTTVTPNIPPEARPLIVRGRVALQDGTAPTEPIAIERVCNGAVRREGYTDFKGNFEFQLGQENVGRDATESGRDVFQNTGNRSATTMGAGADLGITLPTSSRNTDSTRPELFGCELRASLPGFRTTSVLLRPDGSTWSLNVGVIVLTRLENVPGATISATTLAAPQEAREAYQKGEKALERNKFAEAEKEFKKAIAGYADFAAAWALLGEVYRHNTDLPAAKEAYTHAIKADPKLVNPYYGLAIVAVHETNWPEALQYTGEILKLNPDLYPLTHMYNAAANYYLGNLDAAEKSARQFEKLDVNHQQPDSELLLSNILLAKHDYQGASKALEAYLKIVPNSPNAEAIRKQLKDLEAMSVSTQR